MSIRARLTLGLLLGLSVLLVLGGTLTYFIARTALTKQMNDLLRAKALALISAIEQADGRITLESGEQFLHEFDQTNSSSFFEVWRVDLTPILRSASLRGMDLPLQSGTLLAPKYWDLEMPRGLAARAVGFRFRPPPADDAPAGDTRAEAILVVAASRAPLDASLRALVLVLASFGLLVLGLTGSTMPWFLKREFAPLTRLADQAQRMTAGSLGQRFPEQGIPSELAAISARLNDFLRRLGAAFERERQFSDDLAHEFRTPIAELRSLAEVALKWPEERCIHTDRAVLSISLQMQSIINRLLAIARAEQGRIALELEPVNLAEMIAAVRERYVEQASARHLSIHTAVPVNARISSDPTLLSSILSNLLENAVEYASAGTPIYLATDVENGSFSLAVINTAPQLRAEDVPNLFERFWRKDSARSDNHHCGLGLPLARAMATALGYTLDAVLENGSLLRITLAGPVRLDQRLAECFPHESAEQQLEPGENAVASQCSVSHELTPGT